MLAATGSDDPASPSALSGIERRALRTLFWCTAGPAWANRQGWDDGSSGDSDKQDVDLNDWCGVRLDPADDGVVLVDLRRNGLAGAMPPEIGNLKRLRHLYLGDNDLQGSIPKSIGQLSHLCILSLRGNKLKGDIVPELGQLSALRTLSLRDNHLTGIIPTELGQLTELMHLFLNNNNLRGPIPEELSNLEELEQLFLGDNALEGPIPLSFGGLVHLEELVLSGNQLTGPIPVELVDLTDLVRLELDGNRLTGDIPPGLCVLSSLKVLYLNNNGFTGPIPCELGMLSWLERLDLSNNHFTGCIPPELGQLFSLEHLILNNNKLVGGIPCELGRLHHIALLLLNGNQLSEAPPIVGGKGLRQWQVAQRKAFLNGWTMIDRLTYLEQENAQLRKQNDLMTKSISNEKSIPLISRATPARDANLSASAFRTISRPRTASASFHSPYAPELPANAVMLIPSDTGADDGSSSSRSRSSSSSNSNSSIGASGSVVTPSLATLPPPDWDVAGCSSTTGDASRSGLGVGTGTGTRQARAAKGSGSTSTDKDVMNRPPRNSSSAGNVSGGSSSSSSNNSSSSGKNGGGGIGGASRNPRSRHTVPSGDDEDWLNRKTARRALLTSAQRRSAGVESPVGDGPACASRRAVEPVADKSSRRRGRSRALSTSGASRDGDAGIVGLSVESSRTGRATSDSKQETPFFHYGPAAAAKKGLERGGGRERLTEAMATKLGTGVLSPLRSPMHKDSKGDGGSSSYRNHRRDKSGEGSGVAAPPAVAAAAMAAGAAAAGMKATNGVHKLPAPGPVSAVDDEEREKKSYTRSWASLIGMAPTSATATAAAAAADNGAGVAARRGGAAAAMKSAVGGQHTASDGGAGGVGGNGVAPDPGRGGSGSLEKPPEGRISPSAMTSPLGQMVMGLFRVGVVESNAKGAGAAEKMDGVHAPEAHPAGEKRSATDDAVMSAAIVSPE